MNSKGRLGTIYMVSAMVLFIITSELMDGMVLNELMFHMVIGSVLFLGGTHLVAHS